MESNNKLKEINIKNCMCYYFDDIIRIDDSNFDNILTNEISYENLMQHFDWCKTIAY